MLARTPPPLPVHPQNLHMPDNQAYLLCGPIPLRYHRALLLARDIPIFILPGGDSVNARTLFG